MPINTIKLTSGKQHWQPSQTHRPPAPANVSPTSPAAPPGKYRCSGAQRQRLTINMKGSGRYLVTNGITNRVRFVGATVTGGKK